MQDCKTKMWPSKVKLNYTFKFYLRGPLGPRDTNLNRNAWGNEQDRKFCKISSTPRLFYQSHCSTMDKYNFV